MKTWKTLFSALLALWLSVPLMAFADPHGRGGFHGGGGSFRGGGDIRHFGGHDVTVWRSGGWRHTYYNGRLGWWWVVGGAWYFYPQAVYPYPDPYVPPVIVAQQSTMVTPQSQQYWYYCEPSKTYYPYVATCEADWKAVPATPNGASQ
jgi:hypothetical protein